MSRLRKKENVHLPLYVMRRSGRYYLEPKGALRELLGGRSSIPLGGDYVALFSEYKKIMDVVEAPANGGIHTMSQLIDRYLTQVTPTKAESGRRQEIRRGLVLKNVFGHLKPESVTKKDVYQFLAWRSEEAPIGGNREVALLSSVFRKAEVWGVIERTPCVGIEYNREVPRKRYISDIEYTAFQQFALKHNPVVAAYLDFKYVTGLRAGDIRALTVSNMSDEGLLLNIGKTGQVRLMEWTSTLRMVTANLMRACRRAGGGCKRKDECEGVCQRQRKCNRRTVQSDYLFHTRTGSQYSPDGFRSIFYRLLKKAMEEGVVGEWFCEHDIRAKAGSDIEKVEQAQKFLAHLDVKVTAKHYRRKIEKIQPLM